MFNIFSLTSLEKKMGRRKINKISADNDSQSQMKKNANI